MATIKQDVDAIRAALNAASNDVATLTNDFGSEGVVTYGASLIAIAIAGAEDPLSEERMAKVTGMITLVVNLILEGDLDGNS